MPRQHLTRRKDGRYACRYKDQWFMGATEKEVLDAREEYKLRERMGRNPSKEATTVRAYAAKWLPIHKSQVATKCYNDYARQINVLIDAIGDMRMVDVTPTDIMAVWQHYAGYSSSTISRSRHLFNALFDTAMEDGVCQRNPCRSKHAQPGKGTSGSHRPITDEERQQILSSDHFFRPAVMTMLYAGLRRGEALAINIDEDVDFDAHVIHVRHAIRFDSNQPIIASAKTEAGFRDVPMVSILENELRGLHGFLAPARKTGGLMSESAFKSAWDGFCRSIECKTNGVSQKRWRDKEAEWQEFTVRPHDLRHSYCTMLRDAGVDLKLAMRWLGHADEKMILRIYDHVTEFRTQQALNSIESMLSVGKTVGR